MTNQWISMDEEFPKPGQPVLAYCVWDKGDIQTDLCIIRYDTTLHDWVVYEDGGWYGGCFTDLVHIAYWFPLPPAPEVYGEAYNKDILCKEEN